MSVSSILAPFFPGLRQRSEETRRRFAAERRYAGTAELQTVLQPLFRAHNQASKPSCVGQAWTARIEPHVGKALSAVDLWTDARRREGDLDNPEVGTSSEYAIESLIKRGASPYVQGEDDRPVSEDIRIPSLAQELQADAQRISVDAVHRTIVGERTPQLVDALSRNMAVCFGTGVRDPYFSVGKEAVVSVECLGSNDNGHEQGIVGFVGPNDARWPAEVRGCFIVVNSWRNWGGLHLPCSVVMTTGQTLSAGTFLTQCVFVRPEAINVAWDADALEIRWVG